MIVVGGIGTIWGPLLGAALLMLADEGMREFGDWRDIGLGVILAAFVILLPRGLAGVTFSRAALGPPAARQGGSEAGAVTVRSARFPCRRST